MAGTAILTPYGSADIDGYGNTDADVLTHLAPHIYAAHNFNDSIWFGIAEYSRFGLGTSFDNEWAGRFNSYKSDLKTFSVQPTVAYKFNDEWSVGVGLEVMYGQVEIRKRIGTNPATPQTDFADAAVSGSGLGVGGILGVQYKPLDWLSFGLTGRTPVNLDLRGNIEVDKYAGAPPTLPGGTFYGSTTLNLPGSVGVGVAVKPIEDLTIEVDYIQTFWSSYNKLDLEYDDDAIETIYGAGIQKSWRNVSRIQVGAEYDLTQNWALRAGYVWDEAPNVANYDYLLFPATSRSLPPVWASSGKASLSTHPTPISGARMLTAPCPTLSAEQPRATRRTFTTFPQI